MHSKFIVRDGQTIWTGSANMTDDAFTLMENNVVEIDSQALANYYAEDFEQLWEKENFENTGEIHTQPVPVSFAGHRLRCVSCFLRAAVWKSIRRSPGVCEQHSAAFGSAAC